ncbi:crotonobetainyl-CoA:carnitine CoA-transferase CaiB-like acyl-CoA transferase [Bradyrhizobium macuxiense]|uniref:Crotonobetainyl-CoA:carnitine CoA-transferase CaiB-like acyl-CoA transferase n=2 Tax=Bradyrhizobium macuxiense TaxID=1755647 RepID=A0A560KS58_9BRAD|nr:crotonobetainyl-CoA:carnitine CoA-transferase CaiB-like acyl-CoA transferase [Bradyrhizobium macuxiense]
MGISGALDGIRIIDLSRVLSGPFCTQILADHGASVLKVEPPSGDETRTWGPPFNGGTASYYRGVNRNKFGVSLDLSTECGKERLLTLLKDADVLVENFKTGSMDRWGLGYARLSHEFPRLIYCNISGFGADGPLGGLPGYDAAVQAMSGIMSINGEAGGPPTRVGIPIIDLVTGFNSAIGILLALQDRSRSGLGQLVNVSLFDSALSILHPHAANYFASGANPSRTGNAHPNIAPYDVFPTLTVPIFLAVGNDRQFRTLCDVLSDSELASDPRFGGNKARSINREELKERLIALMSTHRGEELSVRLMKAGVPASGVLGVSAALQHAHTSHSEMIVDLEEYRGIASPIKLRRTSPTYRMPPPKFREHQAKVESLDISDEK